MAVKWQVAVGSGRRGYRLACCTLLLHLLTARPMIRTHGGEVIGGRWGRSLDDSSPRGHAADCVAAR